MSRRTSSGATPPRTVTSVPVPVPAPVRDPKDTAKLVAVLRVGEKLSNSHPVAGVGALPWRRASPQRSLDDLLCKKQAMPDSAARAAYQFYKNYLEDPLQLESKSTLENFKDYDKAIKIFEKALQTLNMERANLCEEQAIPRRS
jgi:hypothetical protein